MKKNFSLKKACCLLTISEKSSVHTDFKAGQRVSRRLVTNSAVEEYSQELMK